ncbi:coiled-coil domain-containing protein [Sulfurimonas paralvinellae]|uniref:Uncharacterized protein n=1 Tax=Sulfurimonas paralvinellae TaxID=317658 RepID=A0A7M1B9A2_9BACT|nr:hypothetical protein [Sulfurimonas paralvinellae]QOP46293.1 hypothetical protein FM071_08310 [Sulfurimonas paralvinellae]
MRTNKKKVWNFGKESLNLKNIGVVFKDVKKGGIYQGSSKEKLEKYVEKQGNNFQSTKSIEKMNLKHFIVSPINPELYKNLTEKEKKLIQEESKAWTHKTFNKWGYKAGIEENSDKGIKGGVRDGFHIHIAVNEKYQIKGSVDMLRLRESMTRDFAENLPKSLRDKLGLKNKEEQKEAINKSRSEKQKRNHLNKVKNSPEYQANNETILNLTSQMSNIFKSMNFQNEKRQELSEISKIDRSLILKRKDGLKEQMEDYNKSIKRKDEDIEILDNNINQKEESISEVERVFNKEMEEFKYFIESEESSFNYFADNEHRFFKKLMRDKKKNGTISSAEFLRQVSNNKAYWKMIKDDKKRENKIFLEEKQERFKNTIKSIKEDIKLLENNKSLINRLKRTDMNSLNIVRTDYKATSKELTSHYEIFDKNMKNIKKTLEDLSNQKEEISQERKEAITYKNNMIKSALNYEDSLPNTSNKISNEMIKTIHKKEKINFEASHTTVDSVDKSNRQVFLNSDCSTTEFFNKIIKSTMKITNYPKYKIIEMYENRTLLDTLKTIMDEDRKIDRFEMLSVKTVEEALKLIEEKRNGKKRRINTPVLNYATSQEEVICGM